MCSRLRSAGRKARLHSLGAAGRGRSAGAWAARTPLLAPGQAMDQRTRERSLQTPAGQGALAGQGAARPLWSSRDGEPLGLRVGPALVLRSLPSSQRLLDGPPLPPGSAAARLPVLSGQDGARPARRARLCTVGPCPSFPQRHVPLASPFQLTEGAACRTSSSEGSVLSRGPWRDE